MTSKIQSLTLMKQILEFVELLSVQDQSTRFRQFKIGIFLLPLVVTVSEVNNITIPAEALYLCIGYSIGIVSYFSLFADNLNIQRLLDELECILNECKCSMASDRIDNCIEFFILICLIDFRLSIDRIEFLCRRRCENKRLHEMCSDLCDRFDCTDGFQLQFECNL